jgi:hypothetical protein
MPPTPPSGRDPDEADPFGPPSHASSFPGVKADFSVDTGQVDKLGKALEDLAKKTDKVEASWRRLIDTGKKVGGAIGGVVQGVAGKVGVGGGGYNNGGLTGQAAQFHQLGYTRGQSGDPSTPPWLRTMGLPSATQAAYTQGQQQGFANGGRRGGFRGGPGGMGGGSTGGLVAADFGLDLLRAVNNFKLPGYNRMQTQLSAGMPLDAYAAQYSALYGTSPSQVPNRIVNGGALGTPAQVAGSASFGASIGLIPGVNQQGNAYATSVNQLQRQSPGLGPEAASQLAGGLTSPQVNTQIASRFGIQAAPIGRGGALKPFNQIAHDILSAVRRTDGRTGQLPSKEELTAGLMQGSRMRQQMRVGMGLDDDTINQIITWGIQNAAFTGAGGRGVYDPSDPTQRKLATGSGQKDSISNYAQTYASTQTQTTAAFMEGQYGALQQLVKTEITLNETMQKVDKTLTPLYGFLGGTGPIAQGLVQAAGEILILNNMLRVLNVRLGTGGVPPVPGTPPVVASGGGFGALATGLGMGAAIVGAHALGTSGALPDPGIAKHLGKAPNRESLAGSTALEVIEHPSRLYDPRNWFGDIPIGDPGVAGLQGDFKKRVQAMQAANPNVRVVSGARSASQQGAGQRAGVGRIGPAQDSWHVRGKAADLGPSSQFGWIAKNAQKFGLDSGRAWGEPWHVQERGTAGKRPTPNLGVSQASRGAGGVYGGARSGVGDLPNTSISSVIAQSLQLNVGGLFTSRGSSGGPGAAPGADAGAPQSTAATGGGQIARVIEFARAQIGKPYKANTQGPDTYDCSGLVTAAYKTVGIILPALTFTQVKMGSAVPADPSAVAPGDCLFMRGGSPVADLGHVAIATSSSTMISAPHTGAFVHEGPIPWGSVQQVRRYVSNVAGSAAAPAAAGGTGSWQDFLNAHMETSGKMDPGATMSGPQIAATFYNAGFRGQNLTDIVAISNRESGWNPTAYNFHANTTGDVSLGLVQENVKGTMMSRLKDGGLTDPRQLFDPNNAAHMAFILSQGGTNLNPWGGYKGQSNTYGTNATAAQSAVEQAKQQGLIGDIPLTGGGGGMMPGGSEPSSYTGYSMASTSGGGGRGGAVVHFAPVYNISVMSATEAEAIRMAKLTEQHLRNKVGETMARTT